MNDETTTPAAADTKTKKPDARTARVRILTNGARAKGFTFAAGAVVPGVPLAHAEYLKSQGQAEILEVAG